MTTTAPPIRSMSSADAQPVWSTYTSSSAHDALQVWKQLEQRLNSNSLASSASWVECWLDAYGDLVPHRFLVMEQSGMPRGIALIDSGRDKKLGPFPIRTVHLGTAGEPQLGSVCVEYNRLLVESSHAEEFHRGIRDSIESDLSWEQFVLDGFSESDLVPWTKLYPDAAIRSRESKYFDLKDARENERDVLASLGKSTRSNLRRRLKKYGDLECEWASSLDRAEDIFSELIKLHQARWNAVGQPGAFANDRFRRFQEQAVSRLFTEQRAVLFRVRHQNVTVGCLLLLVDRNRLLDYLSGFAPFDEKPSPGLITHYLCLQSAYERGYDAYDFLVGDKQHKSNLSTHTNQLCWMSVTRPSWKSKTVETVREVKRTLAALVRRRHSECPQ